MHHAAVVLFLCYLRYVPLLQLPKKQAGRTRMASYFETTSSHFGSLSEMTEVTQTVVSGTESELT